jgi:very-short-patch-repair endonuclease
MNAHSVADRRLLTNRARSLRRNSTEAEKLLRGALRGRRLEGIRFRRQVVVCRYVVDFCSAHPKLVIELDGNQHEDQKTYDEMLTRNLVAQGYLVLRFWNGDVFARLDAVLNAIAEEGRKTSTP